VRNCCIIWMKGYILETFQLNICWLLFPLEGWDPIQGQSRSRISWSTSTETSTTI
jgi:hypothetical protein